MNLYDDEIDEIYDHGLDFVGQRLFRGGHQEGSSPFDRHLVDPGRVGLLRNTVIEEQTQGVKKRLPRPSVTDIIASTRSGINPWWCSAVSREI